MITLHHLNHSRSQRVLWLLEELGVPYQIQRYERDPKTMLAPPSLRAVHPLGKSPVITDSAQGRGPLQSSLSGAEGTAPSTDSAQGRGPLQSSLSGAEGTAPSTDSAQGRGPLQSSLSGAEGTAPSTGSTQTLAESGAIIEYLVDTYGAGRLKPAAGTKARQRYTYWLHYAEGSAMTPLLLKLIFDRLPRDLPALLRPVGRMISKGVTARLIAPQIKNHLDFMEAELGRPGPWFTGADFTAADIQMSFPVEAAAARTGFDASRPNLAAYLSRIHARPAYQAALKAGGPYALIK